MPGRGRLLCGPLTCARQRRCVRLAILSRGSRQTKRGAAHSDGLMGKKCRSSSSSRRDRQDKTVRSVEVPARCGGGPRLIVFHRNDRPTYSTVAVNVRYIYLPLTLSLPLPYLALVRLQATKLLMTGATNATKVPPRKARSDKVRRSTRQQLHDIKKPLLPVSSCPLV